MRKFLKLINDLTCYTKNRNGSFAELFFNDADDLTMATAIEVAEDGIELSFSVQIIGTAEEVDRRLRAIIAVLDESGDKK
jgi:hypothetical protein